MNPFEAALERYEYIIRQGFSQTEALHATRFYLMGLLGHGSKLNVLTLNRLWDAGDVAGCIVELKRLAKLWEKE